MTVYSDADLSSKLETVLNRARAEGEVRIKRSDGQEFVLRAVRTGGSPLDVGSIEANVSTEDVVRAVRDGRSRG
jgi:hypothetical protein